MLQIVLVCVDNLCVIIKFAIKSLSYADDFNQVGEAIDCNMLLADLIALVLYPHQIQKCMFPLLRIWENLDKPTLESETLFS